MMIKSKSLLAVLIALAIFSGCKLPMILLTDPRAKIDAKYKFTKGKKIVVLVDDYMSPVNKPEMKRDMTAKISDGLIQAGAVRAGDIISTDKVNDTAKENSAGKKYSIQRVGRDVGADYVLYVNIIDFNLQSDPENPLVQPKAKAFVKVIEVSTGERLWPIDVTGEPIEAKIRAATDIASESTDTSKWTEELSDNLTSEVIGLFFDHREEK
jgi:hypothetical protein